MATSIGKTKKRHGFVSFWLSMGIVANVISIIATIASYNNLTNPRYFSIYSLDSDVNLTAFRDAIHPHVLFMQFVAAISGILIIVGYVKLLNWKKSGFWTITITAVATAIIIMVMMNYIIEDYAIIGQTIYWNPTVQLVATPFSVFILWAILQLKKDGISCWRQLETSNGRNLSIPDIVSNISVEPTHAASDPAPSVVHDYCRKCGKVLPNGAQFCPSCGAPVQGKITVKIDNPVEWKAYFRTLLQKHFAQYSIKEDVPVVELIGDINDVFKLYRGRPNQVYKAEWGKPYDFVLCLGGEAKAVIMLGTGHTHNSNVKYLISKMFAKKLNVPYIGFYTQFPNTEDYVVNRIRESIVELTKRYPYINVKDNL